MTKKERVEKLQALAEKTSSYQERIKHSFSKHGIPVDKFGHAYISGRGGGLTIDDVVNPQFNELDLILALLLEKSG